MKQGYLFFNEDEPPPPRPAPPRPRHAKDDWKHEMLEAIRLTACRLPTLTVDDVWTTFQTQVGDWIETRERRTIGALMLKAHRLGWIVPTNQVRGDGRWKARVWRRPA